MDEIIEHLRDHKEIVIIIDRNELIKNEIYIYLKNVRLNTISDYTLYDKTKGLTYIEGQSTDIIMSHIE